MSFFPAPDPAQGDRLACDAIAQVIVPRTSDVGGFQVRRALPSTRRRMVGGPGGIPQSTCARIRISGLPP